jgi:hypothetical protein
LRKSCDSININNLHTPGETIMTIEISSREFRQQIVGKRIDGVIARPGRAGQPPVVLMLRFDDGSVVEFVSPRSDRLLRQALTERAGDTIDAGLDVAQLELMPGSLGEHGPN